MLTLQQISNATAATRYFNHALGSDYHTEGGKVQGTWHGQAATQLGLPRQVTAWDFSALANNRHPTTGEQLTPRQRGNRTAGIEVVVDAPKSVSLAWALTGDERIQEALLASNLETMQEMERDVWTRVRRDGRQEDRKTGNAVWATFLHETARPARDDGLPDPQLHVHSLWMNLTKDPQEQRWKAAKMQELYRHSGYYRAFFESRLAGRLRELGYAIDRRGQSWELAGIDRALIDKFSRRTAHVEEVAKAKGITDARAKAQLGRQTRTRKSHDLSTAQLRNYWADRLTQDERDGLAALVSRAQARGQGGVPPLLTAREALDYASSHLLERSAVLPERQLLAEALRYGIGSVSKEQLQDALRTSALLSVEKHGTRYFTSGAVWHEEQRLIAFARRGRGTKKPLGPASWRIKRDWLNQEQRAAVRHVLDSCSTVILVRGAAGVGKTTLLQEAKEGIEANGKKVFAFAPTADASRGTLRKEGFPEAETVARLLVDEQLQELVRDQVVLIDEAGLLGTKQTAKLFALAEQLRFRVILVGDRKQHGSVERGGALKLLEENAGLPVASVTDVQRQQGAYKQAVTHLSQGDVSAALDQLDRLGWIKEITGDPGDRERQLAAAYVAAVATTKKGRPLTALVVSPTHAEGQRITAAIRAELRRQNKLGAQERAFPRLDSRDFTKAQRADPAHHVAGDVVQFFQNAKGFTRGERVTVLDAGSDGVLVRTATGATKALPLAQADRFQVFRAGTLELAVGDRVRITNNGFTKDKAHRLDNGSLHTVRGFSRSGDVLLDNGFVVAKDYGHLNHGFVVTSHSSQGKTVDQVFVGQSAASAKAASREQLYVSVSRGRDKAVIYTDDKESLADAVRKSDEHLTATELLGQKTSASKPLLEHVFHRQLWEKQPGLTDLLEEPAFLPAHRHDYERRHDRGR